MDAPRCTLQKSQLLEKHVSIMSELKFDSNKLGRVVLKFIGDVGILRSDDPATQRWIENLAVALEEFHVQVSLLNPRKSLTVNQFKFLKQMKDRIVKKLDLESFDVDAKIERVMLRRWLVASGRFLEDIGDYEIAGPFAAPAQSVQASKSESSLNNAV